MGRVKDYYFDKINAQPEPNEPYDERQEEQETLNNDPDFDKFLDSMEKPF